MRPGGRRWVAKTLLLLFGGQAEEELPLYGGAMPLPEQLQAAPRGWRWRGRGRVRLRARHTVRHGQAAPPPVPPIRGRRRRSQGHLRPRAGGCAAVRALAVRAGRRHGSAGRLKMPAGAGKMAAAAVIKGLQRVSRGALRPRAKALDEAAIRRRAEEGWLLLGD